MHYIVTGLLLGSTAALAQQSQASVEWTPIIIAFFTGAFGSNGISKIIESLWNTRQTVKLREQLEESKELYQAAIAREESCKSSIAALRLEMNQQHARHQADMQKLRRDLQGRL